MPTYDYRCDACEHQFEKFQSMTDKVLRTCPECKKKKLRRLIGTGAGFIFKGSGFYETDYRSDSYKAAAKKDTDSKPSDSSKTDSNSKSDSSSSTDSSSSSGSTDSKASSAE